MAIIWRCDRCGLEKRGEQIVGHEFDYSPEFASLIVPIHHMRDLCKSCMKIANDAAWEFTKKSGDGKIDAVAAALSR